MRRGPRLHAALAAGLATSASACSYDYAGALHCTNSVRDSDETGVDCGGECPACTPPPPETPERPFRWRPPGTAPTRIAWIPITMKGGVPAGRLGAAVAYQGAARGTVLRFGGYNDGPNADAWLVDGDVWTDVADGPPARHYAPMIHDPVGDRSLLVGGIAGTTVHGDAFWWEDGWTDAPAPPWSRYGHSMVFDRDRSRVIVFGGDQKTPAPAGLKNDLWEFDVRTETWAAVPTNEAPPIRIYAAMAYDVDRKLVVLFGGGPQNEELGDTWEYDPAAATWTELTAGVKPQARYGAAMTYDVERHRAVMYGGRTDTPGPNTFNETWELDAGGWSLVDVPPLSTGGKRFQASMIHDAARRRTLLIGGGTSYANPLADVWAYAEVGMSCESADECASGACTDGVCCSLDACPDAEVCNTFAASGICASP